MKLLNLKLIILTYENKIYSENISSVILPSIEGDICILKEHFNFISILKSGIITIKTIDNKDDYFVVDTGYIKVINNNVYILSNKAVNIKNINLSEIKDNQNKIKEIINNKENLKNNLYIKYLYSLNNFYENQIKAKLNFNYI